jgi:hypothetical protein
MDLNLIINTELNKFGKKTVNELKGTLPIKTGALVNGMDYKLVTNNSLDLFSTHYFIFVLNKYSPKSKRRLLDNVDELCKNLSDEISKEIVVTINKTIN